MSIFGIIITSALTCCAYHIGEGVIREVLYYMQKRKKTHKEDK